MVTLGNIMSQILNGTITPDCAVSKCLYRKFKKVTIRRVRSGGALGARAPPPPPPHLEKSSAQKCLKEERKFCPDMSTKRNVHVPFRYDKLKQKG